MTYTYVSVVGISGIVSSDDSGKSSKMVIHLFKAKPAFPRQESSTVLLTWQRGSATKKYKRIFNHLGRWSIHTCNCSRVCFRFLDIQ